MVIQKRKLRNEPCCHAGFRSFPFFPSSDRSHAALTRTEKAHAVPRSLRPFVSEDACSAGQAITFPPPNWPHYKLCSPQLSSVQFNADSPDQALSLLMIRQDHKLQLRLDPVRIQHHSPPTSPPNCTTTTAPNTTRHYRPAPNAACVPTIFPNNNLNPFVNPLMSGYCWPLNSNPPGITFTLQSCSFAFWPALKIRWK